MTHENAGHYAKKHQGIKIDNTIAEKLKKTSKDEKIPCQKIHAVANELSRIPIQVGIQADLIELRLNCCQLGLFGWEKESSGKLIDKNIQINDILEEALDKSAKDNRITCSDCWDIAKNLKIKKLDIGSACEKKGIKIKKCQLGAF
ncbi:MAG: hypothetical protein KAI40_07180 [Desulfobacterales bacterium]|nr:hypothetical protein [Desulfobacterales bacterium]